MFAKVTGSGHAIFTWAKNRAKNYGRGLQVFPKTDNWVLLDQIEKGDFQDEHVSVPCDWGSKNKICK